MEKKNTLKQQTLEQTFFKSNKKTKTMKAQEQQNIAKDNNQDMEAIQMEKSDAGKSSKSKKSEKKKPETKSPAKIKKIKKAKKIANKTQKKNSEQKVVENKNKQIVKQKGKPKETQGKKTLLNKKAKRSFGAKSSLPKIQKCKQPEKVVIKRKGRTTKNSAQIQQKVDENESQKIENASNPNENMIKSTESTKKKKVVIQKNKGVKGNASQLQSPIEDVTPAQKVAEKTQGKVKKKRNQKQQGEQTHKQQELHEKEIVQPQIADQKKEQAELEKPGFSINLSNQNSKVKKVVEPVCRRSSRRGKANEERIVVQRQEIPAEAPEKVSSEIKQVQDEVKNEGNQNISQKNESEKKQSQEVQSINIQEKVDEQKSKKPAVNKNGKKKAFKGRKGKRTPVQKELAQNQLDNQQEKQNVAVGNIVEMQAKQINNVEQDNQGQQMKQQLPPAPKKRKAIKKSVRTDSKKPLESSQIIANYLKLSSQQNEYSEIFTAKPLIFNRFDDVDQYQSLIKDIKDFQRRKN